jgi:hypothetical protein
MEFTKQDADFLERLGFKLERPDENEMEEADRGNPEWTSYELEVKNHPFIDSFCISIGFRSQNISVLSKYDTPIIEKPFTHEKLLAVMDFLRLPIP